MISISDAFVKPIGHIIGDIRPCHHLARVSMVVRHDFIRRLV
jgi:hypothetical protein